MVSQERENERMNRFAILGVFAAAVISAPSFAEDYAVSIDARDLRTPALAAGAHADIVEQAEEICDSQNRLTLERLRFERDCVARIVDDVVEAVDRPTLTAVHSGTSYFLFANRSVRRVERLAVASR